MAKKKKSSVRKRKTPIKKKRVKRLRKSLLKKTRRKKVDPFKEIKSDIKKFKNAIEEFLFAKPPTPSIKNYRILKKKKRKVSRKKKRSIKNRKR